MVCLLLSSSCASLPLGGQKNKKTTSIFSYKRKGLQFNDLLFLLLFQPSNQSAKEVLHGNVPASILMPHLQNLFQQTSIQQVLHAYLMYIVKFCP